MDMPCGCVLLAYSAAVAASSLPATIHFQVDRWENDSWGFHNVMRTAGHAAVAIFADGSRSNVVFANDYRFYLFPNAHFEVDTIYHRSQNVGFTLDDKERVARRHLCCTWELRAKQPDDSDCTQHATELDVKQRVGYGHVAGLRIIRYTSTDENHDVHSRPRSGAKSWKKAEELRTTTACRLPATA